jgi:hypothetical protein
MVDSASSVSAPMVDSASSVSAPMVDSASSVSAPMVDSASSVSVDNAVGHRDAAYSVFTSAYPGGAPEAQTAFYRRLEPWSHGRSLYNFTAHPDNTPADASGAFEPPILDRLRRVKKEWDPQDRFRFAVGVTPR